MPQRVFLNVYKGVRESAGASDSSVLSFGAKSVAGIAFIQKRSTHEFELGATPPLPRWRLRRTTSRTSRRTCSACTMVSAALRVGPRGLFL